jgi:hypothetical protein
MSDLFEQGHACVIGVGGDLPSTVDDAKGFAKILKDPERCAYPESQVQVLTGEQASRANIITALETLASTTSVGLFFGAWVSVIWGNQVVFFDASWI